MFFNFGPFDFGMGEVPPRRPQNRNRNQNQGGLFGGVNEFLRESFMNPLFEPMRQNQQHRPENAQPTFQRGSAKKREQQHKDASFKKEEEIVYNENTGMFWKQKGNEAFKVKNYQLALEHYSKAIELNSSESVFFSNRARCFKNLNRYEQALKDAQEAVELDVDNIKAHLVAGQILAEIGKRNKDIRKVQNSIVRLTKALTLCVGQKKTDQFQQQISIYIYRAKKVLWYMKLEEVKSKRIKAIGQYQQYLEKDETLTKEEVSKKIQEFIEATNEEIIFHIPDYLCCRITLDLMEDPVVIDSGQLYERSAIQEHISKNGKTDPFTRKPISGNLYPCIAIKKAIADFLEKNPWAYEYIQGENYSDIAF